MKKSTTEILKDPVFIERLRSSLREATERTKKIRKSLKPINLHKKRFTR